MLMFPKSRVDAFRHRNTALRWGQAFYSYMKLEKCRQDRFFCDKLYNADEATARAMVASRIDHNS